ncbi:hypothetical protein ACH4VX_16205 [Streptomyces sp. NPDC020731]|uniref:hypothetical protein n=1 Tax=Streptomyces sp. NPDC020731 TaxID=3365085 RepID=UPI003799897D
MDVDSGIVVDADGVLLTLHGRGLPLDQVENDEDLDRGGVEIAFSWPETAGIAHRVTRRAWLHITVTLHDGSCSRARSRLPVPPASRSGTVTWPGRSPVIGSADGLG